MASLSSLPLVGQETSHDAYDAYQESVSEQAAAIRARILGAWMEGRLFVTELYKENETRLKERGYKVQFHSPSIYPPTWAITWSFMTARY